jgi:autotransporter-associated beta strand protein
MYVGYSGTGTFVQTGGTNDIQSGLFVGYYGNGRFDLGDSAQITVHAGESVGEIGTGIFNQTGGTNSAISGLNLGWATGSLGTYNLSGVGQLTAGPERIGWAAGTGTFTQTGGTNSASSVIIGTTGSYTLSAGTLNINNGSFENQGVCDLSNSSATINAVSSIVDFSNAVLTNPGNISVNVDSKSLLMVPAGFAPALSFKTYSNYGLLYQAGSPLDIPAGYTFDTSMRLAYHVNCAGSLTAWSMIDGVNVSGAGSVNLKDTVGLYVNDAISGISGGSLKEYYQYIGTSGAGTFTQSGGSNVCLYDSYIGYNSGCSGTYNLSGGTHAISPPYNGDLYVGGYNGSSASGTYNLSGTGQLTVPHECVGFTGSGVFTQTGGTHNVGFIEIGPSGTYTLSAGTLNLSAGIDNQGTFDLSNSSATINLTSASLDLSNAILVNAKNMSLSISSASILIVPNGFDPAGYFKSYTNYGILHQAGSPLTIPAATTFYACGTINDRVDCLGRLKTSDNITGCKINLNGGLTVSGTGDAELRGGRLCVNDSISRIDGGTARMREQYIGSAGTGSFTHTGGLNCTGYLYIGCDGGNGAYNLSGAGQLDSDVEYVGYSGGGTFVQTAGSNSCSESPSDLYLGYNSNAIGMYNLSGSGKLSYGYEYIGYSGNGTFTQTGGTNSISYYNGLYLGYNSGSSCTYNLTGGTLITPSISQGSGAAVFNFGGGTIQAGGNLLSISFPMTLTGEGGNANIDTVGYSVSVSGILSGDGGLNKLGTGTLKLGGANTYKGNTLIQAGKLMLSSSGSIGSSPIIDILSGASFDISARNSGNGGFTLASAQTIIGAGTVTGNLVAGSGSHIDPGDSAGVLTVTGKLTLNSGALLDFELAAVSASDMISMSSSTLYINNLDFTAFNFTALSGFSVGTYTLIDAGTISGNLGSNLTGAIGSYSGTLSKSGNDLILTVAVPEPGTWILLAMGFLAMIAYRRSSGSKLPG